MADFLNLEGTEKENAYQREVRIISLRSAIEINPVDKKDKGIYKLDIILSNADRIYDWLIKDNRMIKPKKKQPQDLRELQTNSLELEKATKDPVYFYNTYVRKEGQKVLTQEEYEEMIRLGNATIGKTKDKAKGKDLDSIIIPTE